MYTVFHKKTSASIIIYYIFAKLWTIFIKNCWAYTAINFCIYHKFLANNSLISTLNRMGHKSQYWTNSQTGKLYLRMMQSSCLQSLCGHVHSLCSKCSPLAATQACNLLRHSLTALSITRWSRPSHSSWMRWRSTPSVASIFLRSVFNLLKSSSYLETFLIKFLLSTVYLVSKLWSHFYPQQKMAFCTISRTDDYIIITSLFTIEYINYKNAFANYF